KLPALNADLTALQRRVTMRAEHLPQPRNIGELIGMLYTIEGSTRGGRFIYRQLLQTLGESLPLSFFEGYGANSDLRWQEFWAFADASCHPEEIPDALAAAVRMFAFFKLHLDRCAVADVEL
ncbi:MAG: biliverdin-producing heme oxygenase, partial [Gammaproteobacteria bacterium]|nr:biliverdin-producing heme oxygenase [Gammaproteobacteria bacterium]